ncbi:hypothetical protein [Lacinutrix undariae]
MKNIKTNKLSIDINHEQILNDFSIIKFSTSEKYIKYGALFLDEINLETNAKSIAFEQGNSFYALYEKIEISKLDLSKKLQSLKHSDSLTYKLIDNKKELLEIPKHLLSQLLINSISTPKHKRLSFNNLTGKLYLFNPNHFQISKTRDKELIFKIVGLEFKINNEISLELNVKTFSNVLLSKKMDFSKKKFKEFPKYTFIYSTNSLKRILSSDSSNENQFILKQTSKNGILEKNNITFLDFKNLENFKISKIGFLKDILLTIEQKLSKYLTISFLSNKSENIERFKSKFKIEDQKLNLTLIDLSDTEDSIDIINELQSEIKNISPLSSVKIALKENKNGSNIKLINNKNHYKKYNLKDPYKSSIKTQHLTLQDFKLSSKASIKAILKELILKNDILNKKVSIIDWESFNFTNDWIFGSKLEDIFYFIIIKPNGSLSFEKFIPDLFSQNEFNDLCAIFDNDVNTEFIVKDNQGNLNCIKKTKNYTIPEFDIIYNTLYQESEPIELTKKEADKYIRECIEDKSKLNIVLTNLNAINEWNKQSLLNCFSNRNDKKIFVDFVESKTGEILKSYLRDKTRYEILDSQLDIHQFRENDRFYYFVGVKGAGIQQHISRASVIREIEIINNSEFLFDKLLPLMNVDFVKNGELTVLPFPLKYLREWIKSISLDEISQKS